MKRGGGTWVPGWQSALFSIPSSSDLVANPGRQVIAGSGKFLDTSSFAFGSGAPWLLVLSVGCASCWTNSRLGESLAALPLRLGRSPSPPGLEVHAGMGKGSQCGFGPLSVLLCCWLAIAYNKQPKDSCWSPLDKTRVSPSALESGARLGTLAEVNLVATGSFCSFVSFRAMSPFALVG